MGVGIHSDAEGQAGSYLKFPPSRIWTSCVADVKPRKRDNENCGARSAVERVRGNTLR